MRMERKHTNRKKNVRKYVSAWTIIFWICAVMSICMTGKGRNVQAAEYDYPIEKTKEVQVLDTECRDSQGVKYTLDDEHRTAMVGERQGGSANTSGYSGANDGVCVIPEKVSYQGEEYTVNVLNDFAFSYCEDIKVLVLPDTVVGTDNYTWIRCEELQYLYVGKAFDLTDYYIGFCKKLREIQVSPENPYVTVIDGIMYSADKKILLYNPPFRKGSTLAKFRVPDGVETIGDAAFLEGRYRFIELPESVNRVEDSAFAYCKWLEQIDLSNVTYIGDQVVTQSRSIYMINMPEQECEIGCYFCDIGMIPAIFIKNDMGNNTLTRFNQLENLEIVAFKDGVETIENREFSTCPRLKTVLIPDTVTALKKGCFSGCKQLDRIYIPPSVTKIADDVLVDNLYANHRITIYGVAGSAAERYAEETGMPFVDTSTHDHDTLERTIVYENDYMIIKANYCEACGFAQNIEQEIKVPAQKTDVTNGEYDLGIERTKDKMVLDRNMMDEQGIVYSCSKVEETADVVEITDSSNEKNVVIPEIVVWNGREYVVEGVEKYVLKNNTCIESLVLPDTVYIVADTAFVSKTLQYLYIGACCGAGSELTFSDCDQIKKIWISSKNNKYYVKDRCLYKVGANFPVEDNLIFKFSTEKSTEDTGSSTTEQQTQGDADMPTTENTTSIENPAPPTTEKDVNVEITNPAGSKKVVQSPTLKVKKKKTSTGQPYLRISLKKIKGTYIELQVKKAKGKFKKVKLVSNRLKHYKGKLKIGYNPDGKKMWLRIRTYTKKKGKKYYSAWSKPVLVK